jgi:DNA-binding transcriptional LysR family regulator
MLARKLDLNLLPIACMLFEQRSVSRAAEKLGLSQPAVSRALQRMREMLKDPLFVKSRQGVEPTAKAFELVACARDVLARVQTGLFATSEFNPGKYEGKFSISTTEAAEFWLWPEIFKRARALAPRATFRLLRLATGVIPHQLENGEIDLALGFLPRLHGNNLFQQGVLKIRPICLIRADHPIRGKKLTIKQFQRLDHIIVEAVGRNLMVDQVLAKYKIHRKVALYTTGYACLAPIIANSDLVVTVSRALGTRIAATNAGLRVVELPVSIPTALVAQYWHRKYHNDIRNQWLRGVVKDVISIQHEDAAGVG